jgi:D-sedoheptulose 7-phosphate isomerase
MKNQIKNFLSQSIETKEIFLRDAKNIESVEKAAQLMIDVVKNNRTIYACGNGGSACDAMHLCEELVARYKRDRPGIKAMHLADPATLTCWANDYDFEGVYKRQIETFAEKGDLLVAISTTGNSKNVLNAAQAAHVKGARVIALTSTQGDKLAQLSDIAIRVPAKTSDRIQEMHITIIHIWCELIESGSGAPVTM